MKLGRKPGVTRRPIEYVLIAVLLALCVVLVWTYFEFKRLNKPDPVATPAVSVIDSQPSGNLEEINASLEEEFKRIEQAEVEISLEKYYAFAAAADNAGSLYDERSYASSPEFCSQLDDWSTDILAKFSERAEQLDEAKQGFLDSLETKSAQTREKIDKIRQKYSSYREESFKLLHDNNQAEAVSYSEMQTRLDRVLTQRDKALNVALQNLVDHRGEMLAKLVDETTNRFEMFRNRADEAIARAKNACTAGGNTKPVNDSFVVDLEKARQTYSDYRRTTYPDLGNKSEKIVEDWNSRLDAAKQKFQHDLQSIQPRN